MRYTPQIQTLEQAAVALGPLTNDLVFVGGAVGTLLLSDPAAAPPRATNDVDVLVEVATLAEYYGLAERLKRRGFSEDMTSAVICRWAGHGRVLDVIPTEEGILSFTSRWY